MSRVLPYNAKQWEIPLLLNRRKTVTRRVVHRGKSYPEYHGRDKLYGIVDHLNNDYKNWYAGFYNDNNIFIGSDGKQHTDALYWKAPYQPGDILYVRETWCRGTYHTDERKGTLYVGNDGCDYVYKEEAIRNYAYIASALWRPSIHMPKEAARIFLRITDVRVERLQDMKPEDVRKEGIHLTITPDECKSQFDKIGAVHFYEEARKKFSKLWNSTIKKNEIVRYGWDASPWVWVIEFEHCEKPSDTHV